MHTTIGCGYINNPRGFSETSNRKVFVDCYNRRSTLVYILSKVAARGHMYKIISESKQTADEMKTIS